MLQNYCYFFFTRRYFPSLVKEHSPDSWILACMCGEVKFFRMCQIFYFILTFFFIPVASVHGLGIWVSAAPVYVRLRQVLCAVGALADLPWSSKAPVMCGQVAYWLPRLVTATWRLTDAAEIV